MITEVTVTKVTFQTKYAPGAAAHHAGEAPGLFCFAVVLFFDFFFDSHILKFAGFEHLAALQAFDVFRVFIARNHLHSRM